MLVGMGEQHTMEHLTQDQLFSGTHPPSNSLPRMTFRLPLATWNWLLHATSARQPFGAAQLAQKGHNSPAAGTPLSSSFPLCLPCAVDIAFPSEWIAMEVDGPHHFTANTFRPLADTEGRCGARPSAPQQANPRPACKALHVQPAGCSPSACPPPDCTLHLTNACRRLLLRARGWRVVSVPFYHWYGEDGELGCACCTADGLCFKNSAELASCTLMFKVLVGLHSLPTTAPAVPLPLHVQMRHAAACCSDCFERRVHSLCLQCTRCRQ
jgi:hypothetical protein